MTTQLHTAARMALDALEWLLANIRRNAPELSGKAMGNAEVAIAALREALAAPEPEPVALESVHLTRDTRGMCVVRVNGRVAIRDNGDIIDHMATLEWFAAPPAASAPAAPVPDGMATNADEVICPNCAHQFRAIPENVQSLLLASGHEPPFTTPPAAPVVPQPAQHTADCLMCGHCAATGERVAKPAVPLTDEQIRSMWMSSEFRGNGGQVDWFCEGIRAAEAHHGITGGSK